MPTRDTTPAIPDEPVPPQGAVTQWLLDWGRSSKQGLDQMLPVLYQELHRLASSYLSREAPGHTLQPNALVHEAYLAWWTSDGWTGATGPSSSASPPA